MDKINYRVYFTDGGYIVVTPEELEQMLIMSKNKELPFCNAGDNLINLTYVTRIILEKSLDQSSSYIPPKEPNEIKEQKEKEKTERISDLGAVLESHKGTDENT